MIILINEKVQLKKQWTLNYTNISYDCNEIFIINEILQLKNPKGIDIMILKSNKRKDFSISNEIFINDLYNYQNIKSTVLYNVMKGCQNLEIVK